MYELTEWSPGKAGELVGWFKSINAVVNAARECYQAQITNPKWDNGGYVTTWVEGGSDSKYFPDCDSRGFGGDVPEDANRIRILLDDYGVCYDCGGDLVPWQLPLKEHRVGDLDSMQQTYVQCVNGCNRGGHRYVRVS